MTQSTRVTLVGDEPELAEQLVRALLERSFELEGIRVLGGDDRHGAVVEVDEEVHLRVDRADTLGLAGADAVVFFGASGLDVDLIDLVPDGTIVVDATPGASLRGGTGRMPIVPEVNAEMVGAVAAEGPLPLPGPATVGLAVALAPLHEAARVRRVVTTVLLPSSLRGAEGIERLSRQSVSLMQGRSLDEEVDPEHFAFNLRPLEGPVGSGWAADEQRLAVEIALLFGEPPIEVVATGVRAPIFYGLSQSVYVETEQAVDPDEAERLLMRGRGLLVAGSTSEDDTRGVAREEQGEIEAVVDRAPGPVEVGGSEAVHVAHVRADPRKPEALAFWLCLDDQRKGIALNAVATLEIALRDVER